VSGVFAFAYDGISIGATVGARHMQSDNAFVADVYCQFG
jgi:hypothetical protein